jgi:hypothetical protein
VSDINQELMVIPKFKKWDSHNPTMRAEPWKINADLIKERNGETLACLWYVTGDNQHIKIMRRFTPIEVKKKGFVDRFMRFDAYNQMGELPKHWRHPALSQP